VGVEVLDLAAGLLDGVEYGHLDVVRTGDGEFTGVDRSATSRTAETTASVASSTTTVSVVSTSVASWRFSMESSAISVPSWMIPTRSQTDST